MTPLISERSRNSRAVVHAGNAVFSVCQPFRVEPRERDFLVRALLPSLVETTCSHVGQNRQARIGRRSGMELFGNGPALPVVVAEPDRHIFSLQTGWVGKQQPVLVMPELNGIPFQAGLAAR